jgi:transcription antitermination factor NusG
VAVACTKGEKLIQDPLIGLEDASMKEKESYLTHFPWFAIHVRSRFEQGVAEHLEGKGYEWFLPLYKCRKRWSDRIKEVEAPLFPGYLFCRINPQDRLPILKTPGVIQIVGYNRTPIAVDELEVQAIQRMVASGIPNQPWPFLAAGDRVRIESGPLSGLEGILVEFKGNHRLVLSVTLLQRSVAVEIDSAFVTSLRSSSKPGLERATSPNRAVPVAV